MENRIRLTARAKADLDDIAEFTLDRFGEGQARKYQEGLRKVLELLLTFPHMGSDQSHLWPGSRRHVHASHAIYYRIDDDGILVQRILGPGRDPARESPGD